MAEEKKKKNGVTFKQRVERSMGTKFGEKKAKKILEKDAAKGNDPNRVVARPPKRGPDLPKQGVTTVPPKPKKPKSPTIGKTGGSGKMPKVMRGDTASAATKTTGGDPLSGKPRTIAAAKKAGEKYFFDKQGVKKLAVTSAELNKYMKEKGITSTAKGLRSYANTFAPKKVTKAEAEKFKKKRGGGVMKKKSYAGGGAMKKKGMAAGGRTTMKKQMMRGGGMTGMKKKMYAGGGKMKKGYAIGGAMKKKGMKKGGKTMKMRGGGLATRGTNFTIR